MTTLAEPIVTAPIEVRDYGHWMIANTRTSTGRSHRFSANPENVVRAYPENIAKATYDENGPWRVSEESYLPFVGDYHHHGYVKSGLSKAEAMQFLAAPTFTAPPVEA